MKRYQRPFKSSMLVLGIMLVIGIAYAYYFFVFVKQNEQQVTITAYHRLDQVNRNILDKAENLRIRFDKDVSDIKEIQFVQDSITEKQATLNELLERNKELEYQITQKNSEGEIERLIDSIRSLNNQINELKVAIAGHLRFLSQKPTEINICWDESGQNDTGHSDEEHENHNDLGNQYAFVDHSTAKCEEYQNEEYYIRLPISNAIVDYPTNLFFQDIATSPYFTELAVINNDTIHSHAIFSRDISLNSVEKYLAEILTDSVFRIQSYKDIIIEGVEYRVFAAPINIPNTEAILIGLKDMDEIRTLTRSIDQHVVVILLLVLIILIISYPFVKLVLIDKHESLSISDIYVLGLTTIIGYALVTITFQVLNQHYTRTLPTAFEQSSSLAAELNEKFINNIEELTKNMNLLLGNIADKPLKSTINKPSDHFDANFFLIEKDGNIPFFFRDKGPSNGVLYREIVPNYPLSDRTYFTDIINKRFREYGDTKFAIESIYSWRSNNPEVVYTEEFRGSVEGKDVAVAAIASEKFRPFFDIILPPGFIYCIVDKSGVVQFHSDVSKNKRENILEEVNDPRRLSGAINTDKLDEFTLLYKGMEYQAAIQPIEGLEWSIVMLRSAGADKIKEVTVTYFNLMVLLLWFFIVIAITFNVKFAQKNPSLLQKKIFAYNWLLPSENRVNYAAKSVVNCFLIIGQIAIYVFIDTLELALAVHLLFILYSSLTNYILLNLHRVKGGFTANSWEYQRVFHSKVLLRHFIPHFVLIVLLFLYLILNYSTKIWIILLVTFLISSFLMQSRQRIKKWLRVIPYLKTISNKSWYVFFLFTWLVVVVAVPTRLYFDIMSQKGDQIWERASLFTFVNDISSKYVEHKETEQHREDNLIAFLEETTVDSDEFYTYQTDTFKSCEISEHKDLLIHAFWPRMGYINSGNGEIYYSEFIDDSHSPVHCTTYQDGSVQHSQNMFVNNDSTNNILVSHAIITDPPVKSAFMKLLEPVFWIVSLIGLYIIIRVIAIKGLNLTLNDVFSERKDNMDAIFGDPANLPGKIFITSPNGSGILEKLQESFRDINYQILTVDLHNFKLTETMFKLDSGTYDAVLVTGLDYNLYDISGVKKTIDLFEFLQSEGITTFVRSTVEMDFLYDFFLKQISREKPDSPRLIELENINDRLETIFRSYVQVHFPMNWLTRDDKSPYQELSGSVFMKNLTEFVSDNDLQENPEKAILQIQHYGNSYFHDIWNNCTDAEKLILYDLADDGMINASDSISLKNLYQKGIINKASKDSRFIGQMKLFSEAFGNFILESEKIIEAKRIEREYRKKGKWQNTSLILITLITALVLFFLLAEPHILERINSVVALAVAVIPMIIRFSQGIFNMRLTKTSNT